MKIKNVRPGILIIADAGMKLAPGDAAEVDALTPQMERAAATKALVVTGHPKEASPQPKSAAKAKETGETTESREPEGSVPGTDGSGSVGLDAQGVHEESPAPVIRTGGAKSGAR